MELMRNVLVIIILALQAFAEKRENFYSIAKNKKFGGSPMATYDVWSAIECSAKCAETEGCIAHDLSPKQGSIHICYLYDEMNEDGLEHSPGWKYSYSANQQPCEINNCRSNPCMNGGLCTNSFRSFVCSCPIGFAGATCEGSLVISAGEEIYVYNDTVSLTDINMAAVQSVSVLDSSHWMLYSRENFEGRRYLAKYGNWTQFFGFTGMPVMSIKKINNDSCADKPIGVQNPLIIPDSALSVDLDVGSAIINVRLNSVKPDTACGADPTLHQGHGCGYNVLWPTPRETVVAITVDLGVSYEVHGIGQQLSAYVENGELRKTYYTNQFTVRYTTDLDTTAVTSYMENGRVKVFERRSSDYRVEDYFAIENPFIARYMTTEGVQGNVFFSGIRLEFYGCLDCKTTMLGREYRGRRSVTMSGTECQRWDSQSPHGHHFNDPANFPDQSIVEAANYCRNPASVPEGPWCFTTDPNIRWQYCGIPFCP